MVTITITSGGTASIDYTFDFANNAGAHPIDYVDVGMPNSDYDIQSITADVNGVSISDVQPSQYVKPGVALGLGTNSIPAGGSGTVRCHIGTVRNILYPGTQKESEPYASLQFSPTWFDSQYVSGSTDLTVTLFLPVTNGQEPRFYPPKNWPGSSDPQTGFDQSKHVFYRWQSTNANGSTQYIFGAAFPTRLVPAGTIVKPPSFDFVTLVGLLMGFGAVLLTAISVICPFLVTIVIFGAVAYFILWISRQQKMAYLPPSISIEGNGVKRGLTAVEAAILMEQPMDKILTMILFSLVKKNAGRVVTRDPLKIEAVTPQPEGLHTYEINFLQAFQSALPDSQKKALQDMMVALVQSVTETMKGFSRKETVAYYQDIIKRAWDQVESAGTPDVKNQIFGENIEWTMLDQNYAEHTHRVFDAGPVLLPVWWGNYDPGYHLASLASGTGVPAATPISTGGDRSSSGISLPTLPGGAFAASVINGVQSFSAGIIGNIISFTDGVTAKTNPVPVGTSSSSSFHSGGGGGGHCACACAGCACACAGGGR
ncbi:MAG: hypothetical protein ABSE06_18715 [Anaerolineaceae bacterium]